MDSIHGEGEKDELREVEVLVTEREKKSEVLLWSFLVEWLLNHELGYRQRNFLRE